MLGTTRMHALRLPIDVSDALKLAATAAYETEANYIRRAVIDKLRQAGLLFSSQGQS